MQAALSVKGWEAMPRGEIVTRACQAVAAVAHEKSRNAELVYRLQQTHEEGIEAKLLRARFAELQVCPGLHCWPPAPPPRECSELHSAHAGSRHAGMTICFIAHIWAARYNTRLLIELLPKRVCYSFLSVVHVYLSHTFI